MPPPVSGSANELIARWTAGGKFALLAAGVYPIDNSAGPLVLHGPFRLEGRGPGTVLRCASLAHPCILVRGAGIAIDNLAITFAAAPTVRNNSASLSLEGAVHAMLSRLSIDGGPSSGILIYSGSSQVSVTDSTISNMWANGIIVTNSRGVRIGSVRTQENRDGGVEFSQYDGQAGVCTDDSVSGLVSTHDYVGIIVNSCTGVVLRDYTIADTFIDGIDVRQDPRTTTHTWPDRVEIGAGRLERIGAGNPGNSAVRAIHLEAAGSRGGETDMHVTIDGMRIDGTNRGANAVQIEPDSHYVVRLTGVSVANAGREAFDLAGGVVTCSNLSSEHAATYAMVIRTTERFTCSGIRSVDAQLPATHDNTVVLQNNSSGEVTIDGFHSISRQTPSYVAAYDSAPRGNHAFLNFEYETADRSTPSTMANGSPGFYATWKSNGGAPRKAGNERAIPVRR